MALDEGSIYELLANAVWLCDDRCFVVDKGYQESVGARVVHVYRRTPLEYETKLTGTVLIMPRLREVSIIGEGGVEKARATFEEFDAAMRERLRG